MKKLLLSLIAPVLTVAVLSGQNTFTSYSIPTSGHINDIETDGSGNVFIAASDGISRIDLYSKALSGYDVSDGLPSVPAHSLTRDPNGKIFTGTDAKGFATFDESQNMWSSVSLGLNTIPFTYFSHLSYSSSGDRYLGTDNGKVFIQSGATGNPVEKTNYAAAQPLGTITSISSTGAGAPVPTITVLSTNGIVLDISGFIVPITSSSALPDDSVISGIMHKNVSYDGTISGLYTADFSVGAPPSIATYNTANSSIPSNRIQALEAFDNSVYVGTDMGLAVFSINSGNFMVYNTSNSNLPSDDIVSLAVSPTGRLWIATADNSVSTFSQGLGTIVEAGLKNSLQVFPNPATGALYFEGDYKGLAYEVYNASGALVTKGVIQENMDVSDFEPGLYILKVKDDKGIVTNSRFSKM